MPIAPSFGINVYLETFLAKHGGLIEMSKLSNESDFAKKFADIAHTAKKCQ